MTEKILKTAELPWKTLENFPGDVEGIILRQESSLGAKTLLVRLKPGMEITPHGHTGIVQHLVISGSYDSNGTHFKEGDYRFFPAHSDLSPISTKTGATILMIYDPT